MAMAAICQHFLSHTLAVLLSDGACRWLRGWCSICGSIFTRCALYLTARG
jgi:hypothetical protein